MKEKDFDQTLRGKLLSHESAPADHVWDKINAGVKSFSEGDANFDRAVEKKVQSHESEVPDHVWDNIQKDLERRKPRVLISYLISGLALLAILLTLWYTFIQGDKSELSADQHNVENLEVGNTISSADDIKIQLEDNSELNSRKERQLQTQQRVSMNVNKLNAESQNHKVAGSFPKVGEDNSTRDKGSFRSFVDGTVNSDKKMSTSPSNIVASNKKFLNTTTSSNKRSEDLQSIQKHDDQVKFSGEQSDQSENVNIIDSKQEMDPLNNALGLHSDLNKTAKSESQSMLSNSRQVHKYEHSNTSVVDAHMQSSSKASPVSESEQNTSASNVVDVLIRDETRSTNKKLISLGNGKANDGGMFVYDPCSVKGGKKKSRVHCFSFVKKSEISFADFSIGPQYSRKLLKSKLPAGEQNNLLTNRDKTESYMFSYNVQGRIGIKTNSGLTGTVGLSYDRYNERFEFFDPNERRIIIRINGTGDTTEVVVEAFGERTIKHTNTLTFVSIPFTAGYMWEADKFNVGVHGGLALNLLFSKGGRIVADDGSAIALNGSVKKNVFKSSAGFSALGGFVFEYKIRDNLSFIVEPNIKYNLRSLTVDEYSIDQKYVTTGINVGLRTIINKKITQKKKYGVN